MNLDEIDENDIEIDNEDHIFEENELNAIYKDEIKKRNRKIKK